MLVRVFLWTMVQVSFIVRWILYRRKQSYHKMIQAPLMSVRKVTCKHISEGFLHCSFHTLDQNWPFLLRIQYIRVVFPQFTMMFRIWGMYTHEGLNLTFHCSFLSFFLKKVGNKKTLIDVKKVKFCAEMPKYFKIPPKMPKYFILVRKWQNMWKIFFYVIKFFSSL